MNYKQKQNIKITGLLPAIISVIIFLLTSIVWNVSTGFYVLGSIMFFYALMIFYEYYRTMHNWTLLSVIYMIFYGSVLISIAPYIGLHNHIEFTVISKVLIAITIILLNWLLYLNYKKKLKWRGIEILELAAQNVEQTKGSHTDRPLPTGKVDFSKKQLEEFSDFFQKNLLGLTYVEENRIVFMPLKYKNEYFALYNPNYNYQEKTWVAINFNGNVSVNISKADYLDYKEDLAFDSLCNSLSDVIIEFIELFIDGSEVRIIDKMDNLKINIFI
ncbi:MAG: hypothetical protein ABFR32_10545 [Bacteroidota bacterium]